MLSFAPACRGVGLDGLRRLVAKGSSGFETLAHIGAGITMRITGGLRQRRSCKDLGMVALVIPASVVFVVIVPLSGFAT